MENQQVDAIILVGSQYIEATERRNQYILDAAKQVPVMLVNGYLKGNNIYCILSEDKEMFLKSPDNYWTGEEKYCISDA